MRNHIIPPVMICFLIFMFIFLNDAAPEQKSIDQLKKEAFQLYQKKDYVSSIEITKTALEMSKQQFGEKSLQYAEFLGNLGGLYNLQGNEYEGDKLINRARRIRLNHGELGTELGIQTEAKFDLLEKALDKAREGVGGLQDVQYGPQTVGDQPSEEDLEWALERNDYLDKLILEKQFCIYSVDGDMDCDEEDKALINGALGKCLENFSPEQELLDLDLDGCVTQQDERLLESKMGS